MKSLLILFGIISLHHTTLCQSYTDYYNLGYEKMNAGEVQGALTYLNKALELNRTYSKALLLRGICFEQLMQKQKDNNTKALYYALCIADFDSFLSMNPEDHSALVLKGNTHMSWYFATKKSGIKDKACACWLMARSMGNKDAASFIVKYCK